MEWACILLRLTFEVDKHQFHCCASVSLILYVKSYLHPEDKSSLRGGIHVSA